MPRAVTECAAEAIYTKDVLLVDAKPPLTDGQLGPISANDSAPKVKI